MLKQPIRLILASAAIVAGVAQMNAGHLTPDEALQRARSESSSMMKAPGVSSQFKLAHTETASTGVQTVYVFSRGTDNGFIITSADDRFPAVLGYSDNGTFDFDAAPPAFKWWLGEYSKEAAWYLEHENTAQDVAASDALTLNESSSSQSPTTASRINVTPLVTTVWNQSAPFNNDCPVYNGSRSVTGCVATAMAQVINYHKYPVHGKGSHTYTYNGQTMSFDFANATFDWANMIDNYNNGAGTTEQKAAVANLMYACGVSVDMQYSPNASGAYGASVPYALTEYFGFDNDVKYLERDFYTAAEWDELIYNELAVSRPIIFGGQANDGGHEFVCDGYRTSDGFFHFNWGWGGAYDGYFILSNLEPGGQGIGGYAGGYNRDQHAICNIKQPSGSNLASTYPLTTSGGLQATNTTLGSSTNISFSNSGTLGYCGFRDITLPVVAKITSSTNNVTYGSATNLTFPSAFFDANYGLRYYINGSFSIGIPSGISAGTYKMTIAYIAPDGSYQDVPFLSTENAYLNMVVGSDNSVTFTKGTPKELYDISVTQLFAREAVTSGVSASYYIYVKNNSETVAFNNSVNVYVCQRGSITPLGGTGLILSMAPKGYASGTFSLTLNLPDGLYDMLCYDPNGTQIGGPFPLIIGNVAEPTGVTLDVTSKELTEGEEFTLTATVAPDDAADKTVTWTSSNDAVATVSADGVVKAIAVGTATITATTTNGKTATCAVTVKASEVLPTGITLSDTEVTLPAGNVTMIGVTVLPADATNKAVTWTSSNEEVAKVQRVVEQDYTLVVRALSPGTAVFTATTVNGLTATCTVTVSEEHVYVNGVTLDVTEKELTLGEEFTLTATVTPEDASDKSVSWRSSMESVATVDQNGVVKAVGLGVTTIKVTTKGWGPEYSATCTVTVVEPTVEATGVTLDVNSKELTVGEEFTLTATVSPNNATDKTVTWTTSNAAVATVSAAGVVKGIAAGNATITATTTNGKTAACAVTVVEPVVLATSITLDKTSFTGYPNDVVTLVATVLPENTTNKTVAWESTDTNIATVDQTGKVTVKTTGNCTIIAKTTDGSNLQAECSIIGQTVGIESILGVTIEKADIYTLNGMLVKRNADRQTVETLAPGLYILRVNGSAYKVVKH
ncbi:MAG: C10 family peptidase [Muribaculaceae bacterium]|nr:C10 family peptidase [Muribaculaceae bacterium]